VGVFALATIACQNPATSTTAPEAPALNFTNGPASPGNSGVMRFQSPELFGTFSDESGLVALHFSESFFCNGGDLPVFEGQEVMTPAGIVRAITHVTDAPIYIYRAEDLDVPDDEFCSFVANGWVYQGTHDLILTGDFAGRGPTIGWSGHGDVSDHDGAIFRYSEHQNAVVQKDGTLKWLNENIRVHPTGKK
jgi:hypothetical protein